jgi:hypothetical protein
MARKNQNRTESINSPNRVRQSLLEYIKHDFPYQKDWYHPITGDRFDYKQIQICIEKFKGFNRQAYKALFILFSTNATRSFIASRMLVSTSTLRRIWDSAIDTLLFLMIYPSLDPGSIELYEF